MAKSYVYEWPKGVVTRLMEGSESFRLYEESRKTPDLKKVLNAHMEELHKTYLKYGGK